jgi:hypothetical protein
VDWAIYGVLIACFLAFVGAAAFLAVRLLQGWRTLKRFRRHLGRHLASLAATADRTGEIVERVSDQDALEASLGRLRVALARLNVLRAALDEVGGSFGRVASVYPRK